jgi:hypothetical protein
MGTALLFFIINDMMINEYGAGGEMRIGRQTALLPLIHHKSNMFLPGIIPKLLLVGYSIQLASY